MDNVLEIKNLNYRKNYKKILTDINVTIPKGKIIGLLGENGAGKTTLMRLIAGLSASAEGKVKVNGKTNKNEIKKYVSFNDQLKGFPKNTRLKDIVSFYQNAYDDFSTEKFDEIQSFLKLDLNNKLSALSTGTLGKFVIALAISRDTKLYLLDEPLNGIDSMSRKKIISSVIRWKSEDSSIIISDHYVTEIANLLDGIIIIKDNSILKNISVVEIQEKYNLGVEDYFEKTYEEEI